MGVYRLRHRLPYAGVRQTEILVHVIQGQLLPQPVCALTQGADPAPDRGDMLADAEVKPLDACGVDLPASRH